MLRQRLIHPEILAALAAAGHGSTVLIADGNFPVSTATSAAAARVYLNFAPGLVAARDVLEVLVEAIPIEAATLMVPEASGDPSPAAHSSLVAALPAGTEVRRVGRSAFYELARSDDLALVIATGETALYANVLLTIGVVRAPD